MESNAPLPKKTLWASRILSGLPFLFLLFDGVAKLFRPAPVVEATVKLGFPEHLIIPLGITLTLCTILYAIPRTVMLGAILLTGYLGGAVVTHVRMQEGWFPILFPVFLGVLLWGGLYLRESRLQALVPLASPANVTSTKMRWAGYVLSVLPALLLLFSAWMKLSKAPPAMQGFVQFGFPESVLVGIGIVELLCTALYLIPRTAVLGAILLTGYLGGATATHLRVGDAFITPIIVGAVLWGALYLRDARIRALIPLRN